MAGCLIMLAVPSSDSPATESLPALTIATAKRLDYFLAENAKSARAFLKKIGHPKPIAELSIVEIGHRPDPAQVKSWLAPWPQAMILELSAKRAAPGLPIRERKLHKKLRK